MIRGGILVGLVCLGGAAARGEIRERRPTPSPAVLGDAPLDFEENRGQADRTVAFLARGRGFLALFTEREAVFACGGDPHLVRMGFPGARSSLPEAASPRPGVSHYPPRVDTARHFGRIERRDLWPGVDLVWDGGDGRSLEYTLLVAPGADPRRIALSFEGARGRVDGTGALLLETPAGTLRHGRPRAFQGTEPVAAAFLPRPDGTFGFALGPHDPARPLLIDPQVVFNTKVGGSASDEAWAVAADPAGYLYFAGWAVSTNLQITAGVLQPASAGNYDAFVVRRTPRGALLSWATYLGGTGADLAYALAVDATGAAVVAGGTQSTDFPTTAGAFQPSRAAGSETGFVARLAPGGGALAWSTYVGGTERESVRGLALGADGDAYLVGTTSSADFPSPGGAVPAPAGGSDAFVARLSAGGGSLAWVSFLGGTFNEEGRAVALGLDGTVFVAGMTESPDFPGVNDLQPFVLGVRDAFVAALPPDGSAVLWATPLGGQGAEEGWGIAVDPSGSPWVAGYTTSLDFPLVSAVDAGYAGTFEAFATKFEVDGSALLRSTYLGGSAADKAEGICIDGAGVVYIVGRTSSTDFPLKDAVENTYGGGDFDAFATALTPSGTQVLWSSYMGGGGSDFAMAGCVDRFNALVLAGRVEGTNGDGLTASIIAVPLPPFTVQAFLTGLKRVRLEWSDQGGDEDGYIVQRRQGSGPWADVKTTTANVLEFTDLGLGYGSTYTWRVLAFNAYGRSSPSAEVSVTTLPDPVSLPAAPTGLGITGFDTRHVDLAWTDNSADEDAFVLERFDPFIGFFVRASLDRNTQTFRDDQVLPMRTYRYRVRAVNPRGSSAATPEATAVLDASFALAVVSGRRTARDGLRKDTLVLEGTVAKEPDTRWYSFDPAALGLELRLDGDPVPLLDVPPGYDLWKFKKGKWILKFPFSPRGKILLTVDPVAETFKFSLTKANLVDLPEDGETFRVYPGPDGAEAPLPWVPRRKPGDYRFP